jgi:hypothetical protein
VEEVWQSRVRELMRESRPIILLAGVGRSLAWELETLIRDGYVAKTVLMLAKPSGRSDGRSNRKSGSVASHRDRLRALLEDLRAPAGTKLSYKSDGGGLLPTLRR